MEILPFTIGKIYLRENFTLRRAQRSETLIYKYIERTYDKTVNKSFDVWKYFDCNKKICQNISEFVMQMENVIDKFMTFLNTQHSVTSSICAGNAFLSSLTLHTKQIQNIILELLMLRIIISQFLTDSFHHIFTMISWILNDSFY